MPTQNKNLWFFPKRSIKPKTDLNSIEFQDSIFSLVEVMLAAGSEKEVIEVGIGFIVDQFGLSGASFIPFNELKAIAPPIFFGEIGDPKLFKLDNYIELVDLRQECKRCVDLESADQCVLLADGTKFQIRCFNLMVADRKEGIINLYWPKHNELTERQIEVTQKVISLIEHSILQAGARENARIAKVEEETKEIGDVDIFSVISRSVERVCQVNHIDQVFAFFPMGFELEDDKLFDLYSVNGKAENDSYFELIDGLWQVIQKTSENVFLENKNKELSWSQLIAIPIAQNENGVGQTPDAMVVLLSNSNVLDELKNDPTINTIFQHVGMILSKERAYKSAFERSMIEERVRLSREFHDGIAQTLAFLLIQMKRLWRFYQEHEDVKFTDVYDESYQIVADTYDDLRNAIHDLRRAPELELKQTIIDLCADFEQKTGIQTIVSVASMDDLSGTQFQLHIIRILQETFSNIRKHSGARLVRVDGNISDGKYHLNIADDGVGFEISDMDLDRSAHFGLTSIQERARILGAEIEISSELGQGTTVGLVI